MRIQICADLHLNNSNYGRVDKDGFSFRTKDFCEAFSKAVDHAISGGSCKPDRFAIVGDIYEDPHPNSNVRKVFNQQIRRLSEAGIVVDILVGNHDACYHHHALQPVEGVGFTGVNVYYSTTVVETDEVLLLMFPHSQALERQEIGFRDALQQFAKETEQRVKDAKSNGKDVLFFGHFETFGAKTSDNYVNEDGSTISLSDLAMLKADYIFLGDYHGFQQLKVEGDCKAFYVGSLERSTFNDVVPDKGFMVYDSSSANLGVFGKAVFVKQDGRRFLDITANINTLTDEVNKVAGEIPGSVVRIHFVGTSEEHKAFPKIKKDLSEILDKAMHIVPKKTIVDPSSDKKVEELRKEMDELGHIESSDILEIVPTCLRKDLNDEAEIDQTLTLAKEIAGKVKQAQQVTTSGKPGRIMIHGVKLHNFQRYGETNNVVEFDKGAEAFLGKIDNAYKIGPNTMNTLRKRAKEFLTGLNPEERKLISIVGKIDGNDKDSNGAGKSGVLEAISYAFFEKLIREFAHKDKMDGKSTTSVMTYVDGEPKPHCFVEVVFSSENELWLVRRGRKTAKSGNTSGEFALFCLSSSEDMEGSQSGHRKKDSEEILGQLLKMDYETLSNSVMFGQMDSGRFIRGTDKVKKEILIKILQLTVLDSYLAETRELKRAAEKDAVALQSHVGALQENMLDEAGIQKANADIKQLADDIAELEKSIVAKDAEIASKREAKIFTEQDGLKKEFQLQTQLVDQKRKELSERSEGLRQALVKSESRLRDIENDCKKEEDAGKTAKNTIELLQASLKSFSAEENSKAMTLVAKAKEAKPTREVELSGIQDIIKDLNKKKGSMEGGISDRVARITKFKDKLARCLDSGGKMPCGECESMMPAEHFQKKVEEYEKEKEALLSQLATIDSQLSSEIQKEKEIKKKLVNIQEYINKEASLVSQKSSFELNQEKLTSQKIKVSETDSKIIDLKKKIETEAAEISEIKKKLEDADKLSSIEMEPLLVRSREITTRLTLIENEVKIARDEISSCEKLTASWRKDKDGKLSIKSSLETKVNDTIKTMEKIQTKKSELDGKNKLLQRLARLDSIFGLDGVRTQIIEKYIPLLNSFAAEYLDAISKGRMAAAVGMEDGKLEISVAGGSAPRGELLSGGEFERLRLSMDIALGLLSLYRNESAPDFVCLDEIFAPIDEGGKDLMFEVIARLQKHFRMVLIISHDRMVQERIKNVIVISKMNDISSIEKQAFEDA